MGEREAIAWVSVRVWSPTHMGFDWHQTKMALSRVAEARALGWVVEILGIE